MSKKRKGPNVGVAILADRLEVATYDAKTGVLTHFETHPLAEGVMGHSGDRILDTAQLTEVLKPALANIKPKVKSVNLALTGTLLRLVEMPKMEPKELYLSLSSEAERYKAFDDTEAIVDFHVLKPVPGMPASMQRVVFGAVRKDAFDSAKRAFAAAKVKISNVDIAPIHTFRAMAVTELLDGIVDQIGEEAYWGSVFVEDERIRFSLWQNTNLIELREVSMDTRDFAMADADAPYIFDLVDEIRRTAKTAFPALWLTDNLPMAMVQGLEVQLGVPIRPCMLGPGIQTNGAMPSLPTIGAALATSTDFPFDFNFLTGAAESAVIGKKEGTVEVEVDDGDGLGVTAVIVGAVALCVICFVFWLGLFAYEQAFLATEVSNLVTTLDTKTQEMANLNTKKETLQVAYDLRARIADTMETARRKNALFQKFAEDLKTITPERVWLYSIDLGQELTVDGKALDHQAVLGLARNFDQLTYAQGVTISSIKQDYNTDANLPFYRFTLTGTTELKDELVKDVIYAGQNPDGTEPALEGDALGTAAPAKKPAGAKPPEGLQEP